jgi:preprotein translocase subunit Sec63
MKDQFEKQRKTLEKQLERAKDALMELIASSKEDKRIFDEQTKDMRTQLVNFHSEMQRTSLEEKRMFTAESKELRKQLRDIQSEMKKNAEAAAKKSSASPTHAALPRKLDDRLELLQIQIAEHASSFLNRVTVLEEKDDEKLKVALDQQSLSARKIEDRLDR